MVHATGTIVWKDNIHKYFSWMGERETIGLWDEERERTEHCRNEDTYKRL